MSFPVKVPDEIYARLKERAEKEGITFQEAMVRLITEPQAEAEELRREIAELRGQVEQLAQRVAALEEARAKAEASLRATDEKLTHLAEKKPEVPPHEHPQYAPLEELRKISQSVQGWDQRLADLEQTMDSVIGEMDSLQEEVASLPNLAGRVGKLENDYTALVNAFNSWVPTWKKVGDIEGKLATVSSQLSLLSEDLSAHKDHEEALFARIQKILGNFKERLVEVEAKSHHHLGQRLKMPKG